MIELFTLTSILYALLGGVLTYLVVTGLILLRNKHALRPIRNYIDIKATNAQTDLPSISVLIPARNEEATIRQCVESVLQQSRRPDEVMVLDDQSTDATPSILNDIQNRDSLLTVHTGSDTPESWLGKTWACHQLSESASGDILLFLDADVWLEQDALAAIGNAFQAEQVDLVTVWPEQQLKSLGERVIIPLVYFALVTLLPIQYGHRKPRWMPLWLYTKMAPLFAAACGQCMAFKRGAYQAIGGHKSVRDEIVEDVALAKRMRSKGYSIRLFEGVHSIHCRMYTNSEEIREGFRKNFFAGFNYQWLPFISAALLHIAVFIIPWVTLVGGLIWADQLLLLLSGLSIILMLGQRLILAAWFNWKWLDAITHPLGVIWFQYLGLITMRDRIWGNSAQWKGRSIQK